MRPATATAFLLLGFVSCAYDGRIFILDDGEDDGVVHRVRRDAPPYGPPAPAPYHPAPHHGPKGRVGPVYTFVKTDPQANFKWGVRHRAGAQYGRRSALAYPQGGPPVGPLYIPREGLFPNLASAIKN